MSELAHFQHPNLSGFPTDYVPVTPNDDANNTGEACIGLYATTAGTIRAIVTRGNIETTTHAAFTATPVPTVSGGSGSDATVDSITVDAQGRITDVVWAAGDADYVAGDVITLTQGAVSATYTLLAADVVAGALQALTGKTLQGVRTVITGATRDIPIAAQALLPLLCRRVLATGTTATGIFAIQG